jgi:hypothetical protein
MCIVSSPGHLSYVQVRVRSWTPYREAYEFASDGVEFSYARLAQALADLGFYA